MTTRTRRTAVTAALAAVLATAPALMSAAPAYADLNDSGFVTPQIPRNKTTGEPDTSSVSGWSDKDYFCKDGALYRNGIGPNGKPGLWYNAPYYRCMGSANTLIPGTKYWTCNSNLLVFRFYGSRANPVKGWNASMANWPTWCEQKPRPLVWSTNALDAEGGKPLTNPLARKTGTARGERDMGTRFTGINAEGFLTDPRFGTTWALPGVASYATTGRAFAGNNGCVKAQGPNPVLAHLNNPNVTVASKNQLVRSLFLFRNREVERFPGGPRNAQAHMWARKSTGLAKLALKNPAGPRTWANLRVLEFDDVTCGNVMQYPVTVDASSGQVPASLRDRFKVTGACYIPLERMGQGFTDTRTRETVLQYPDINKGGGLRLSPLWRGTVATSAKPRGINNHVATPDERFILDKWRQQMASWYRGALQQGARVGGPGMHRLKNGQNEQILPADPFVRAGNQVDYAAARSQGFNQAKAIDALLNASKCDFGSSIALVDTSVTPRTEDDPETPERERTVTAKADLELRNSYVLQAGGKRLVQQFSVKDNGLVCTDADAATCAKHDVRLKQLHYTLRVTLPDSMRWDTADATGDVRIAKVFGPANRCQVSDDGRWCDITVSTANPGTSLEVEMLNYTPTRAAERLTVTVRDARVQYSQMTRVTTTQRLTARDPITGEAKVITSERDGVRVDRTAAVNVTGTPAPLTRSGTTWTWTVPVIGATSVG